MEFKSIAVHFFFDLKPHFILKITAASNSSVWIAQLNNKQKPNYKHMFELFICLILQTTALFISIDFCAPSLDISADKYKTKAIIRYECLNWTQDSNALELCGVLHKSIANSQRKVNGFVTQAYLSCTFVVYVQIVT